MSYELVIAKKPKGEVSLLHNYVVSNDEFNLRFELIQNASVYEDRNINIDSINPETGRTALIEAAANGRYEIVKMLVEEFGCNVNKKSVLGRSSALHVAVENDYRQVATFLFLNGADINATDKYGCTPLHLVNTLSIAKMLKKFGGDCLVRNSNGHQPSVAYKKRAEMVCNFDKSLFEFLFEFNKQPIFLFQNLLEILNFLYT